MVMHYPFVAVVGMELAKRSLLLHAVDPRIGGTLLQGHRGCAKSTLARGFAALLPAHNGQTPAFVNVPLGVTEDRLLGSVQAERLVRTGEWIPQQGLLEAAHGGVLYLDEVNLLHDALSDLLLDSAASGVHYLERDGLSRMLDSKYILIGTMNPEEGELRPQLADRFAHGVSVQDDFSPEQRVEIAQRRMAFDDAPELFWAQWEAETTALREQIDSARTRLLSVQIPGTLRHKLAQRAKDAASEGLRAELAVLRSARASAALRGVLEVSENDLEEAWTLCMTHRESSRPPQNTAPPRPPSPSTSAAPSQPGRVGATAMPQPTSTPFAAALTPKEAHFTPIPLHPMQKPRIISLPEPLFKSRAATASLGKATAHLSASSAQKTSRVRWQASVVTSLVAGWRPAQAGWRWMRSVHLSRPRFFVLLDCSRSTGANQFVAAAREIIAGLMRASMRVYLLLVHEGHIRCGVRNGVPKTALKNLESLGHAAGKSPLATALQTLRKILQKSAPSPQDVVCVCSDGMPTLLEGQTSTQAAAVLRASIRRLSRTACNPVQWFSPEAGRAFSGWLDELVAGTSVQCARLKTLS
jgi:Mg-chelatase subunit ChlI/Mg-chelatase subunit ChlD